MMRIGVRVPPCRPVGEVVDLVREAERMGFHAVWHPDSQLLWRDTWSQLTADALATDSIRLGVAVTNPVTRHPSVTASAARTAAELAPGRIRVGIGIGDSAITFAGLRAASHRELASAVRVTRGLLRGETIDDRARYRLRDVGQPVPVYVAASGPRNLALGGQLADGAIVAGLDWVGHEKIVRSAAADAGRDPAEINVIVTRPCVVTDDLERGARVFKPMCLRVAQLGGAAAFARAGFDLDVPPHGIDEGDIGHPDDWEEAVRAASQWIPDDAATWFARTRCLFGSPPEIAGQLRQLKADGVTEVLLAHPGAFTLPIDLIDRVGQEVLPLLRAVPTAEVNR